MNVMHVNGSAQCILPMNLKGQDNYEMNIQKQIANLQEQMKMVSGDKEKSVEQKMSERQEIQKQIQNLNIELRQHQIQKRQAAAAKAAENDSVDREENKNRNGLSEAETGVIISLSTTKEQIAGMKKVRTDLQGKLRTATTEKEQKELQEKIDNITNDISEKVNETQDTISSYQNEERDEENHANHIEEMGSEENSENEADSLEH